MHRPLALMIAFTALTAFAACTTPPAATDQAMTSPEFAPTPYTAEEIRTNCPQGRRILFRMANGDGFITTRMDFEAVDATGTSVATRSIDPPGPASPAVFATWPELRDHARFPAARTVVRRETIDASVGRRACTVYRVASSDEPDTWQTFYFDVQRPGPPIRLVLETAGTERVVMEMLSDTTDG